jgi:hypothetical protein
MASSSETPEKPSTPSQDVSHDEEAVEVPEPKGEDAMTFREVFTPRVCLCLLVMQLASTPRPVIKG